MLDFNCMGSAELLGTGRGQKIQSENIFLSSGIRTHAQQSATGNQTL